MFRLSGPPLFQYQQKAEPLSPTNFPTPVFSWGAYAPSAVRRATLPTALRPSLAFYPLPLPNTPPPNPEPPPHGPPFKPKKEALGGGGSDRMSAPQQQAFAIAFAPVLPIPGTVSWRPSLPVANPTAARSFAPWSPATARWVFAPPTPLLRFVAAPATIAAARVRAADLPFYAAPISSGIEPPKPSWGSVAPAWIARAALHPSALPPFSLGDFRPALPVADLAWKGWHPDFALAAARPTEVLTGLVPSLEPIPNPPAPDLSWGPSFADLVWPNTRLTAAAQQAFTANLDPITNPPAPVLAWGPSMPPLVWPLAKGLAPHLHLFATRRYDSPGTDYRWEAVIADPFVRVARRTPLSWSVIAPEAALAPVAWLPSLPDWLPTPRLTDAAPPTPPLGEILAVAVRLTWMGRSPVPVFLPATTALLPPGPGDIRQGPWPCVHVRLDGVTTPTLLSLTATAPTLTDLTLTAPTLLDPEVC